MAIKTLINGQEQCQLSSEDRGLSYGDGLFETLRVAQGRPLLWQAHVDRLMLGCHRLSIPAPNRETLYNEAMQLCLDQDNAVLKLIITRGEGGRGYKPLPVSQIQPTRILQLFPFPDYPSTHWDEGINMRRCQTPVSINPALAGLKHLNRLENVLARQEWSDAEISEGLMTDGQGHWIEGTMSNVFLVINHALYTPDLSRAGVNGIMRQRIISLAKELSINVNIDTISDRRYLEADELFVTNSVIGIWPVKNFEGQRYQIGPVVAQLRQSLLSSSA